MSKNFNEFSLLKITRSVFYSMTAIAIYFSGVELNSSNLKLASAFFIVGGILGIIRNLQRLTNK